MSGYDRAITIFSPDGHLFQVEYAMEAVKKGTTVVGIQAQDCIVLAAEVKAKSKLQVSASAEKILKVDEKLMCGFAGLSADARVLINRVRVECQSQYLRLNEAATTEEVAAYIASIQQRYTVRGGRRPFGLSLLLAGISESEGPQLFVCDPSGMYSQWKGAVIGRNDKSVREYLEKNWEDELDEEAAVDLTIKAFCEFVENGKNIQMVVVRADSIRNVSEEVIVEKMEAYEAEKEKKKPSAQA